MPVPIIVGVGLGAVVVGGLGIGGEGSRRQLKARRINRTVSEMLEDAEARQAKAVRACQKAADKLGRRKVQVMTSEMHELHEQLSRFRGFGFEGTAVDESAPETQGIDPDALDKIDFGRWNVIAGASSGVVVVASGAGTSSAVVTGASTALVWGGATTAGGTSIGTLSGAALTNATLAWFGGGSLAAGGGGVAAGTLVLSGVATAPAALVGGVALLHIGNKNLKKAEANKVEAIAMIARADAENVKLGKMTRRARDYERLLAELQGLLAGSVRSLRTIANKQTDASKLTAAQRAKVRRALELFAMTDALVNAELMRDGELTDSSKRLLTQGRRLVKAG